MSAEVIKRRIKNLEEAIERWKRFLKDDTEELEELKKAVAILEFKEHETK